MNTYLNFSLSRLYTISRMRFWIYILGPFLIGAIASGDPRLWTGETMLMMILLFIFFTFPANLLIYGVNDIYDYETDKHNPKKIEYEQLVLPKEQTSLWNIITLVSAPFLLLTLFLPLASSIALTVFLFCSVYYSAPPIRAKARPAFDILFSSIIYISPAAVAFFAAGGTTISLTALVAGLLWASAMQTYSAVPDIEADTKGGVSTLATYLGYNRALLFCVCGYLASSIIGFFYLGYLSLILGAIYLYLVAMTMRSPRKAFVWYKKFPLVNTVVGMIIFFTLASRFLLYY